MKLKRFLAMSMCISMIFMAGCSNNNGVNIDESANTESTAPVQSDGQLANGEKVTLRFAWWGSQARHESTQKVAEMFMEKYPNVTIQMEPYDSDGYFQKLGALVGSNDVWDIWQFGNNFGEYKNSFIDLNPFIDQGIIETDKIDVSFLEATQYEGKQASISLGLNARAMAYNPALFTEAGLEQPEIDWTYDDFIKAAKAIKDVTGEFGICVMDHGFLAGITGVNQEDKTKNFFLADDSGLGIDSYEYILPYFEMMEELIAYGAYPDPGALNEIGTTVEQDFVATGEAGITCLPTNQFINIANAAAQNGIEELKLIPFPRRHEDSAIGSRAKSSQGLCISPSCEYPEVAAAFINFMINDVEANKVLAAERGIPVNSDVRSALSANLTQAQKKTFDFIDMLGADADSSLVNVNEPAPWTEINDRISLNIQKMSVGEIDADQAAKDSFDFAKSKFE